LSFCLQEFQHFKKAIMGQNKLNKKEDNKSQASSTNTKNHKGDTGRSSDQGRKSASGGTKDSNNRGQRKEA
jgi:hypothetical protein